MDSQTETFIVQETQPMWPGEKPMPFITVNGKMSYVPHRWGAKPGDVITITRKGQENDAIVGRVSEVLAGVDVLGADSKSAQAGTPASTSLPDVRRPGIIPGERKPAGGKAGRKRKAGTAGNDDD